MKTLTVLKGLMLVMVMGLIFCSHTPPAVTEKPVPPVAKTEVMPEKPIPVSEKPVPAPEKPVVVPEKPVSPKAEISNFDTIIPEDVYAYFSIENISRCGNAIDNSFLNKLWNDPEVQKFVENISDFIQNEITKDKKTQITLKDITSLKEVFSGQIVFVLDSMELRVGKTKKPRMIHDEDGNIVFDEEKKFPKVDDVEVECIEPMPHCILLAQVSQNKDKLESFIEKICADLTEEEIYKQKEDYKDISYFTFYNKKESLKTSYGYIGDIFFLAYGDKGLKRIIDIYKGSDKVKPLSTKISYQKLLAEIGSNRLSTVFVNCPPIVSSLKQWAIKTELLSSESFTPEKIDKTNKTWDNIIEFSGLGDLKSISWGTRLEADGLISVTFIDIPGTKRGLWKILSSSAKTELKTLKAVPKDTMVYSGCTISLPEVYDEIMNILSNVVSKEEYENEIMTGIKEFEQMLGLKLKEDILSVFDNEFALLEDLSKMDTNNPQGGFMGIPMKIAIIAPIAQSDKFNQIHDQLMKTFAAEMPMPFVEKKYEGFTFNVIEVPSFDEGQEPKQIMGYFFTNDMLVIAMPGNYLKDIADAISGKDNGSLVTDPDFVKITDKTKVETKKIAISYLDFAKYVDFFGMIYSAGESQLKSSKIKMKKGKDGALVEDSSEPILKAMPKIETLKKYFLGCKSYNQFYPTTDGFMARNYIRIITEQGDNK